MDSINPSELIETIVCVLEVLKLTKIQKNQRKFDEIMNSTSSPPTTENVSNNGKCKSPNLSFRTFLQTSGASCATSIGSLPTSLSYSTQSSLNKFGCRCSSVEESNMNARPTSPSFSMARKEAFGARSPPLKRRLRRMSSCSFPETIFEQNENPSSLHNKTGTGKFQPIISTEWKHVEKFKYVTNKYMCITCMLDYQDKSLEELRLEDYVADKKGGDQVKSNNVSYESEKMDVSDFSNQNMYGHAQDRLKNISFGGTTNKRPRCAPYTTNKMFSFLDQNCSSINDPFHKRILDRSTSPSNVFNFNGNRKVAYNFKPIDESSSPTKLASSTLSTNHIAPSTPRLVFTPPLHNTNTSQINFKFTQFDSARNVASMKEPIVFHPPIGATNADFIDEDKRISFPRQNNIAKPTFEIPRIVFHPPPKQRTEVIAEKPKLSAVHFTGTEQTTLNWVD